MLITLKAIMISAILLVSHSPDAPYSGIDGKCYVWLPATNVFIDVGHGGIDGGTSKGDLLEKDINLQIAKKLHKRLQEKNISSVLSRTDDYALSDHNDWQRNKSRHLKDLGQRYGMAETLQPKIVISIHANWSNKNKRSGPIILYQDKHPHSLLLARMLQTNLNKTYGANNTPHPGKTYFLLKYISAPTVIVETGFLSNNEDLMRLTSEEGQAGIVESMTKAIIDYLLAEKLFPQPNDQD